MTTTIPRAAGPQLHTHVVVAWEWRDRRNGHNPGFEIVGVPGELMTEFSSRSQHIEAETERLIVKYVQEHGRRPSATTVIKLRAEATLRTRPEKTVLSLAELTEQWRARGTRVLGEDSRAWAARLLAKRERHSVLRADDVPLAVAEQIGRSVVEVVGTKRSTWRRWNLYAEAARQVMDVRFASTVDREAVMGLIVDAAEHASVTLTPPELPAPPVEFRRPDGSSMFRPKHGLILSSTAVPHAKTNSSGWQPTRPDQHRTRHGSSG